MKREEKESVMIRAPFALFAGHHRDEFLVVDLSVAVDVCFSDHLVDFLVRQLLAEVGHDVAQLGRGDVPVAVLVEYSAGIVNNRAIMREPLT